MKNQVRKISAIAFEISKDWQNVSMYAKPYLNAMYRIHSIDERYHLESARDIVRYFLANASSWRGENARRIKNELKSMLK